MMSETAGTYSSFQETQALMGESMPVSRVSLHGSVKRVNACSKQQLLYRIVSLNLDVVINGYN